MNVEPWDTLTREIHVLYIPKGKYSPGAGWTRGPPPSSHGWAAIRRDSRVEKINNTKSSGVRIRIVPNPRKPGSQCEMNPFMTHSFHVRMVRVNKPHSCQPGVYFTRLLYSFTDFTGIPVGSKYPDPPRDHGWDISTADHDRCVIDYIMIGIFSYSFHCADVEELYLIIVLYLRRNKLNHSVLESGRVVTVGWGKGLLQGLHSSESEATRKPGKVFQSMKTHLYSWGKHVRGVRGTGAITEVLPPNEKRIYISCAYAFTPLVGLQRYH